MVGELGTVLLLLSRVTCNLSLNMDAVVLQLAQEFGLSLLRGSLSLLRGLPDL